MAEQDIKISFSNITMQKIAFRERKENVGYLLEKYDKIMKKTVFTTIKQGQVHENLQSYLQKTKLLSEAAEEIFEAMETEMEQWKTDFEEADEDLYEE